MCGGGPSIPPYVPPAPVAAQPQPAPQQIIENQSRLSAASSESATQQAATGQGGGSTMLTEGMGIDPASLALGRKSLLGG